MIDYLIVFPDEAAAIADPIIGKHYTPPNPDRGFPGGWRSDYVIPNVQAWRHADDTYETVTGPGGEEITIVHHQYLEGFALAIAFPEQDDAHDAHDGLKLSMDREAAVADEPFVMASVYTEKELQGMMWQPVFMGSDYPFGPPTLTPYRNRKFESWMKPNWIHL